MQQAPPPDDTHDQDTSAPNQVTNIIAPPQDPAAERYVIGAALQHPNTLDACAALLTPDAFYQPKHEQLWQLLLDLKARAQPTEPINVLAALRENGLLRKIPGTYLHTLISEATNPTHGSHYARQVAQLAVRRKALTALNAAHARLNNPSSGADTHQELADAAEALQLTVDSITNPNPTTTWAPVDLEAALQGQSLDPPPDMCERTDGQALFYSGGVHTISGESESGKTWVTLFGATQLMTLNMDVIFIDFEDRAERVVGRLLSMGAQPDTIRRHFHYVRPDRPLDALGQTELTTKLNTAVLVIIDGVTEAMTLHGYDLNSNEDAAKFYGLLPRWLADHGPAVVMIDHVVKDHEKQGRYAIGAQHKLAGIDAAAYTVKTIRPFGRGLKGTAKISISKDRPGFVRQAARGNHIADFTLDDTTPGGLVATLDPPGHDQADAGVDTDRFVPTKLMEKISDYLQRVVLPQSTKNILDGVPGKDTHKRQAITELVAGGYVHAEPGPRNSTMHTHHRPFPDIGGTTQPTLED